jgi:hypothetical protein
MHWYSNNGYWKAAGGGYGYGGIVFYNNYESDLRGYAGYWDGSGFGMLNSSGNWQIRIEYGNAHMELYRITYGNDFRPYITYDRDNTGFYSDPNGTSNFARFTSRTKNIMGLTAKYNTPRSDITGDSNYWVGTMGWGTTDFNSIINWGSGFFDTWGSIPNSPGDTSHYVGVQAFHYASGYNSGYGFQIAGGPTSSLWWRNIWSSASGWRRFIDSDNINSQEVYSSAILRQFNVVYGDNWNDVYTANSFRIGQGHNISGANGPQTIGAYNYGSYMSFRFLGSSMFQFWIPENSFNAYWGIANIHFRAGWNGGWGDWYRLLMQRTNFTDGNGLFRGDVSVTPGGATTGHWVDSGTGYNGATSAYLELHPQSDNWATTAYRFRAYSADAGGSWLYFERYTVNGGYSTMGFVDRNTQNLYWYGSITANYSDIRLKKNISIIKNPIQKLWGLHGVEFEWVPNKEANNERDYKDVGLIAQEVQEVLPEAVKSFPNGYLSVNYDAVVALLVETVKQQQLLIDNLTQRIENLENN